MKRHGNTTLNAVILTIGMILAGETLVTGNGSGGCYIDYPEQCASVGTTVCVVWTDCGPKVATCTANAYRYPVREAGYSEQGLTKTAVYPTCAFWAAYLDCNNMSAPTTCPPNTTYVALDYLNGQVCPPQP